MAEGYINKQNITVKKYSVAPTLNPTLASITFNNFDSWVDLNIATDVSAYGNPISISANGYGGVPVPATIFSNSRALALQWKGHEDNNVNIFITYAKDTAWI